MILSQAQAEAVSSAMCALDSVRSLIAASFESDAITATHLPDGEVIVIRHRVPNGFPFSSPQKEEYANHAAFAVAYGLVAKVEVDPLQGAANWLLKAHAGMEASALAGRLSIGYNRAKRLHDVAASCCLSDEDEWPSDVAAAAGGLTQTAIER